ALALEIPVLPEPAIFDLVASRQRCGWAPPFSPPPARCVQAFLPQSASAQVQARRLAWAQLREFASQIQPFSFSASGFESFRRSEIDPEDSRKSPPVLASGAHRRTKRQYIQ